jgi:hypothetical protein
LCGSPKQKKTRRRKKREEKKEEEKKKKKEGDPNRRLPCVWVRHAGCPGVRTRCYLFSSLVFFLCPPTIAPPLHFVSSSFDYVFGTIIQPCIIV